MNKTITDPKVDRLAAEKIVVARVSLLMKQPFFGNIATRLIVKNADDWCPTAATDGRHFYYNSEFVNKLKDKEVEFLVGHELLHCIYSHCGEFNRISGRDSKLWNIACDYAVNRDCVKYNLGTKIATVPILYDDKYEDMCAEQIYDDLLKNAKKINADELVKQLLDQHLSDDGSGSGDGDSSSGPGKISSEERQQIQNDIKEAMLAAAQAVGAGNIPSGIKRFIDGLTESKMNWKEVLVQQIESQIKNDFTFMKPSRRGWSCDAILPSLKKAPSVEVTIAIDMSGSISQEMARDFLSEIKGIMDQHSSVNIGVMCFDTKTYNYREFTEDDTSELLNYELTGGGGTNFDAVWEFLKSEDKTPKQLLVMTDGYPNGSWGDPDYTDTVFLIHGNNRIIAPFGITVSYG